MAYDPDLTPLLEACSNQDLDPLVKYLVKPFTSGLKTEQEYIKNRKNPSSYIFLIVQELQLFGGNTIANAYRRIFGYRRKGISYKKILHDVAKKMKVKYGSTEGVDEIEGKLLIKVLDDALKRMDQNQKEALFEEFRKTGLKDSDLRVGVPLTVFFAQAGVQMTGFLAYRLAVIVANAVAKAMIRSRAAACSECGTHSNSGDADRSDRLGHHRPLDRLRCGRSGLSGDHSMCAAYSLFEEEESL